MSDMLDFGVWVFESLVLELLPVVVSLLIAYYVYKCGLTGMETLRNWFSGMFAGLRNFGR